LFEQLQGVIAVNLDIGGRPVVAAHGGVGQQHASVGFGAQPKVRNKSFKKSFFKYCKLYFIEPLF